MQKPPWLLTRVLTVRVVSTRGKKASRRSRKQRVASPSPPRPQVLTGPGEMPEGAELSASDGESATHKGKQPATVGKNESTAARRHRSHLLGDDEDASNLHSVNITIKPVASQKTHPVVVGTYIVHATC